jgi:hypothetical protein
MSVPDAGPPAVVADPLRIADPSPTDPSLDDPLLADARRIADLPLDERPGALERLNAAVVAELGRLEEV